MQKYTFPRIRQCFSQRILSFLMFFTLISAFCRLDGGSFIGSFWICKTWVQNHFFCLRLVFFSFYPSHHSRVLFLIFNRLIMRWLSLLCSVIDGRNVYKIHHAIHHVFQLIFLLKVLFLCTWFGTNMKVFGTKLASGFKILYLCGVFTTQIPQWQ